MTAPAASPDRLPAARTGIFDDLAAERPDRECAKAADWEAADSEPADRQPADRERADSDPADWDPADSEQADSDPADSDPADSDPADSERADSDLADWERADREPAERGPVRGGPAEPARARGNGGWFATGGAADVLRPGPVLAGFAADAWAIGLGRLTDDELIGVMRAARRLASWAAAMELAATGDLWRRRWAEEQAGDCGAARHADDEIAAALMLTGRAADQLLSLAVALRRLPLTTRALTVGDIDLPRAMVIADEVTGLDNDHAAAVEQAIISAATGQTTGQLRAATRRAVLATDPRAARKRKERALQEARVERWDEHAGTAALAGRDLPPASVLAADQNLSALARQLKGAGAPGTLDQLRAQVYLALLTGTHVGSLIPVAPSDPGTSGHQGSRSGPADPEDSFSSNNGARGTVAAPGTPGARGTIGSPDSPGTPGSPGSPGTLGSPGTPGSPGSPGTAGSPGSPGSPGTPGTLDTPGTLGGPGLFSVSGTVNLTMPLATWLGLSDAPGDAAGFGPLDADDSRAIADALAARADTRWCLTLTDSHGRPVAHGCARTGPPPGQRRAWPTGPVGSQGTGSLGGPLGTPRAGPGSSTGPAGAPRDGPDSGTGPAVAQCDGPRPGEPSRPGTRPPDRTWSFSLTLLAGDSCDHARETAAYRPSPALRHLMEIRHATCTYPGCRRPAARCDADHTVAYHRGGKTCLCNIAPLCRAHHKAKQAHGWHLRQVQPGVLAWTTPSGRTYTESPTVYPA